ncbi:MAG: M3 family metallopeptidase [Candidatus Hodarchaeota archaeon]
MKQDQEIIWDLTPLFLSIDDPKIDETIEKGQKDLINLENDFKGKITSIKDNSLILDLFTRYEKLLTEISEPVLFANLLFSADQTKKDVMAFNNRIRNISSEIEKRVAFIEIELGELLYNNKNIVNDPLLSPYRRLMEKILERHPHKLSEEEEKLIIEKDQFGIREWQKLQSKWLSEKKFELKVKGEKKHLSWGEVSKYFQDPERSIRKEAITKVLGSLGEDKELFTTCLRNICGDHFRISKRRKYSRPIEASFLANSITGKMFKSMIAVVERNIDLFQDFLLFKAQLMGTKTLLGEDLGAPYPKKSIQEDIPWDKAKAMILEAFTEFDLEFAIIAKSMFENRRIDASPRLGKSSGAWCASFYRDKSSFILQTYVGKLSNIQTTAHELGHAIHNNFASTTQNFLNRSPPAVLAEVSSEFCSLLLTEKLFAKTKDLDTKKELFFSGVERIMNVIFRVASLIRFEESLYNALDEGIYLSPEKITEYYSNAREKYFGKAIEFLPEQYFAWISVPHFYIPYFRYYNYPYVFAELLVLSLYNRYKSEGNIFIPKLKAIISAGGSKSPNRLTEELNIDLTDESFWEAGINEVRVQFQELKALFK